jgi:hypothetical protein
LVEQKPIAPACAWCGMDPVRLVAQPATFGQLQAAVFFCGRCRKIASVGVVGMLEDHRGPNRTDSGLVLP